MQLRWKNDAIFADINADGSLILITTKKGNVELRKETGQLVRQIGHGDAVTAKFSGTDILVTTKTGKVELRKETGSLIRQM